MISDDEDVLLENVGLLIHELIIKDPMMYIQPHFHDYVIDQVSQLIGKQIDEVFFGAFTCNSDTICDDLDYIINRAMRLFYNNIAPKRSSSTSFIRIKPNIEKTTAKINYLKNIPQPLQRTPEWYEFRSKCLTASNIWKTFISESTRNQLIYEKCQPINVDKFTHVSTDTSMHWGNKYEPLSILFYEKIYKTKISDFGCIPHKNIAFLAASPDGINTSVTSNRFGRMIEVKNIVNRDINGNPKMEYWIQMQVQMEVCDLNECDFLETRFTEYDSLEAFETDGLSYNRSNDGKRKGAIIMYFTIEKQPHYEYAPIGLSQREFEKWEEENINNHSHMVWIKNIYWKLDELSCVLVLRNKLWFAYALPLIETLWKTIENDKKNGFLHRAPNKRNKVISKFNNTGKCYINIHKLMHDDEVKLPIELDIELDIKVPIELDIEQTHKKIFIKQPLYMM
jgi:putative phage-type endonuclease